MFIAHQVTQQAIFGVVLRAAPKIWCSVNVGTRPKNHRNAGIHGVFSKKQASLPAQIQVKGASLCHLVHIEGTAFAVSFNIAALNAVRAICRCVGRLSDIGNRHISPVVTTDGGKIIDT